MCGIIGKIGIDSVAPSLIKGLEALEYRGYDSAGIAVLNDGGISRVRASGRVSELAKIIQNEELKGGVGIGHTRWATHGSPTEGNAHPHIDEKNIFALVHNGIIENSEELKATVLTDVEFSSETDTEVAVQLIGRLYKGEVVSAIAQAIRFFEGSFAFGIICRDCPDKLFAAASGSPLLVFKCENGCCIASDACAVDEKPSEMFRLQSGEICCLKKDSVAFYNSSGERIEKYPESIDFECGVASKNGYEHFMLKEIYEQPAAVKNTVEAFLSGSKIIFQDIRLKDYFFKNQLRKIEIIACGSAYHAGLSGKLAFEKLCKIPCQVIIASEYRYSPCFSDESTLAVFISQSGETADTLASLRLAKSKNAKIVSIVNVAGSAIARESDNVILTRAGKEIAVATTKAYSAQLAALYGLAVFIGEARGTLGKDDVKKYKEELSLLSGKIEKTLSLTADKMKELSAKIHKSTDIFYMGRLGDYAAACEGSLKMKEITYINSQAYASGELKHGAISLINEGTPVIAIANSGKVYSKSLSNISEVTARGGRVFLITDEAEKEEPDIFEDCIKVPATLPLFQSSLAVIPLQLLSYYTAKLLGRDIDKPKNLAKSVTVE